MRVLEFFLFTTFMASPAFARTECARVFTLGFNGPAISKDKARIETLSTTLMTEIQKRMGCTFHQKDMPTTRGKEELRLHRIDFFAFSFVNADTTQYADPIPLYAVERILLVDKKVYKKEYTVSDYIQNPKITFAILSGGMLINNDKELKILQKGNRVVFDPFPDGILHLIVDGKAQAAFITNTFLKIHEKKHPVRAKSEMVIDGTKVDLALLLSKKRVSPLEKAALQTAIASMRRDGTIRRILLQYVTADELAKYYQL